MEWKAVKLMDKEIEEFLYPFPQNIRFLEDGRLIQKGYEHSPYHHEIYKSENRMKNCYVKAFVFEPQHGVEKLIAKIITDRDYEQILFSGTRFDLKTFFAEKGITFNPMWLDVDEHFQTSSEYASFVSAYLK